MKKIIYFIPFMVLAITYTVMTLVGSTVFTMDKLVLLLVLLANGFYNSWR